MRALTLSIDLDDLACYRGIHGHGRPREKEDLRFIRSRVLPRLAALCDALDARATLFVIGCHLELDPQLAEALRDMQRNGYELASHSQHHPYALTRLPERELHEELQRSREGLGALQGESPAGFRAPGYAINARVAHALDAHGYAYDASLLASPAYQLAKAGVLASMRLRAQASEAVCDTPAALLAPAEPYRMDPRAPWRRGTGLWEFPISLLPRTTGGVPWIGTTLALLGPKLAAQLTRFGLRRPIAELELHALDLVDDTEVGDQALRAAQPDLRVPVARKRAAIEAALREAARRRGAAQPLGQLHAQLSRRHENQL